MKKQVKDQIEKMVKAFNEANSKFGETYRYEYHSSAFKRGKYSVEIFFSNIFDSYDFIKLMDIITANGLHFHFAHRKDYSVIYLQ